MLFYIVCDHLFWVVCLLISVGFEVCVLGCYFRLLLVV